MNTINKLSNNEINISVTLELLKIRYPNAKSFEYDKQQNCFWKEEVGVSSYEIYDYCNEHNDYMPVAIEHEISIEFYDGLVECEAKNYKHTSEWMSKADTGRAVCECFLMTREYV